MEIIASALMGLFILPTLMTGVKNPEPVKTVATTTPVVAVTNIPEKYPTLNAKMTSYNAVPEQTDGTPFITASGAYSNPQVVAARSHDLSDALPFGTVISIEQSASTKNTNTCGYGVVKNQIGYRVIADVMNISKHKQVDVLLNQNRTVRVGNKTINPSIALGICHNMVIKVIGRISIRHIPKTQAKLVSLIKGNAILAIR